MGYKPPFYSASGYYFNKGLNVIPLIPRGKKPAVKWSYFSKNKISASQLNYYRKFYPNHNIGIVTGSVSELVVVDVDGEEGTESLKEYMMPMTLRVDTSRGYHLYYRLPKMARIPSTISLLPKVDIKSEGGYVVAPPSVYQDGKVYTWSESPSYLKDIPTLPDWIIHKIRLREEGLLPKGKAGVELHKKRKDWLKDIMNGVGEGKRNGACSRYAGLLLSRGYDEDTCIKELVQWNLKNLPPLPEKEVLQTFYSIYNRDRLRSYQEAQPITLDTAKRQIKKYLVFEDDTIVDIVLAVAAMYDHESGPIWLVIVGPPSSGKTEVLRSLRGFRDTVFMESITSRTLFTGMRNARGILERHDKPFMLMINKDFGSILAKSSVEKGLILQQLRGVFDQEYYDETGGGKGTIEWNNRLNFLSAATQDIESKENQRALGDLGERFLYYRMRAETDDMIREKALTAIKKQGGDRAMRNAVANAMLGVLKYVESRKDKEIEIPENMTEWLVELCMIAVKLRTRVKRDTIREGVIEYKPSPEGVMRMLKSVKGLLVGVAIIRGRNRAQVNDYGLAARVVIDSVPTYRKLVLKLLYFKGSYMTVSDIVRSSKINEHTSRLLLEDLSVVGLAEKAERETDTKFAFGKAVLTKAAYRIKPSISKAIKDCGMEGLL